jgi:outer membrane lipoprotein carrier protein
MLPIRVFAVAACGFMRRCRAGLSLLALCCVPAVTLAANDVLHRFFSETASFKADFEQTVFDDKLRPMQATAGAMLLARPGRFRWDYAKPYEQHIVGDGEMVWLYDVDLEQVTVRAMKDALGSTPAQLLSTTEPLEKNFTVELLGDSKGLLWFELVPLQEESQFQRIRLAFDSEALSRMELQDALGNTTLLEFHNMRRNITVDAAAFHFEPPPGVDVVGP